MQVEEQREKLAAMQKKNSSLEVDTLCIGMGHTLLGTPIDETQLTTGTGKLKLGIDD